MTEHEKAVIDNFHDLYYNGPQGKGFIYDRTYWFNTPCLKCPLDLWVYQEIIAEIRPDLVVETGTHLGGSALFIANIFDILGHGEVISIDIVEYPNRPVHPRIQYINGSSVNPILINSMLGSRPEETRLIILDSEHTKNHVLKELELFAPYVSLGSYLIVEDTNINGHPIYASFGDGPFEAVKEFLNTSQNFMVDQSREKFLMTFNPSGYLKRIAK